jgi:hypothetical protein
LQKYCLDFAQWVQNLVMKMINDLFNIEKFIINEAIFIQSLKNIYSKKLIVYWVQKFGIQSLFVLIQFEIDQVFNDRANITVTLCQVLHSGEL